MFIFNKGLRIMLAKLKQYLYNIDLYFILATAFLAAFPKNMNRFINSLRATLSIKNI